MHTQVALREFSVAAAVAGGMWEKAQPFPSRGPVCMRHSHA